MHALLFTTCVFTIVFLFIKLKIMSNKNKFMKIFENDEIIERRELRSIAMRIQKQLITNWFPNYVDGDQ